MLSDTGFGKKMHYDNAKALRINTEVFISPEELDSGNTYENSDTFSLAALILHIIAPLNYEMIDK